LSVLEKQQHRIPFNIFWLAESNKYIENQYELKNDWGETKLVHKDTYDNNFVNEFDFVCSALNK
jgi:hypothetical protein